MSKALAVFILALFFGATVAQAQTLPDITSYLSSAAGNATVSTGNASPIDLLFESSSYVPPFYRGRPLPSAGSTMHFVAIAHFTSATGATIADSNIAYTWSVDGRVQGSLSGAGKSSILLPAPTLYGSNTVSVDAQATGGSAHGSASLSVSSIDPQPTLYQDDPLIGIEYYNALGAQTSIPDIEMTFATIPYFVAANGLNDPRLSWNWTINNQPVVASSSGNEITVNATNSNGLASLAVSVTSRVNPLLDAQGTWNLSFGANGFGAKSGN
jgi:hypothetical protein